MIKLLPLLLTSSLLSAHSLKLHIKGIANHKGQILIAIYKNEKNFLSIHKFYKKGVIRHIKSSSMNYTFRNIPKGKYAISIFHDENKNRKIDRNFIGIPKEGYGFSNNVRPKFRPANFKEAEFRLNKSSSVTIRLKY